MRILTVGFLVFLGWSVIATYIYVCKIKGLCDEPIAMQIGITEILDANVADTSRGPAIQEHIESPNDLKVYFAFDKFEFNSNAETDVYFAKSYTYLDQNTKARLNIAGYTDAIGTDEYNQSLGYRRAQSLQYYFVNKGIPENKIVIESKGEKEPADDNNTAAGRANNRRTIITIKK